MQYIEIINKTKSCIVINSCKLVLKPVGEIGDKVIIDDEKLKDNDIVGLHSSGFIEIKKANPPKSKEININDVAPIKTGKKRGRKPKVQNGNTDGNTAIIMDHGQAKKTKMVKSLENVTMVDSGTNVNDGDDGDDGEDRKDPAFIDTK